MRLTTTTTTTSSPRARSRVLPTRAIEIEAIVGDDELDPRWKRGTQVSERPLDVLGDGRRVGIDAGHHDAADGRLNAPEVREARGHVFGQPDVAHVLDSRSRRVRGNEIRVTRRRRVDEPA